jgi:hypothetical protein
MRHAAADAVQYVRLYVIVVGVLVAIVGTLQISRWRTYLPQNQFAWLAVAIFNFSSVFGTFDVWVHDTPGGVRSYVSAVATTFALFAVSYQPLHNLGRWRRARQVIRSHTPKE